MKYLFKRRLGDTVLKKENDEKRSFEDERRIFIVFVRNDDS